MQWTREQLLFLNDTHYPIFLHAPAGCGKTTLLAEKIQQLLRKKPDAKVLFLVFNVMIRDQLTQRFSQVKNVHVSTLHSLLYKIFSAKVSKPLLLTNKLKPPEFSNRDEYENYVAHLDKQNKDFLEFTYSLLIEDVLWNPQHYIDEFSKYDLIVVDEVQDLTPKMLQIFSNLITAGYRKLIFAGDLNQAIYSFQGVDIESLKTFLFVNNFSTHTLHTNFRSAKTIISVANALTGLNIQSAIKTEGNVLKAEFESYPQFLQTLTYLIHHIIVGDLNVTYQPRHDYEKALSTLLQTTFEAEGTLLFALRNKRDIPAVNEKLEKNQIPYLNIAELNQQLDYASEFLENSIRRGRFVMDSLEKASLFKELLTQIASEYTPSQLLEKLFEIQNQLKMYRYNLIYSPNTPVKIGTIHSVKGLEFHTVILPNVSKGVFPPSYSKNLEEEKRIFYVGITRARHNLVVGVNVKRPSPLVSTFPKEIEILRFIPEKRPKQMSLFG